MLAGCGDVGCNASMSVERAGCGAEFIAEAAEGRLLRLLPPDLLVNIEAGVAETAQEYCSRRYGEPCLMDAALQITPERLVFDFLCRKQESCPALCERAATLTQLTARRSARGRLGKIVPLN